MGRKDGIGNEGMDGNGDGMRMRHCHSHPIPLSHGGS